MFGRDCNPAYLFSTSGLELDGNSSSDHAIENNDSERSENSYTVPSDSLEWIESMDSHRNSDYGNARTNILQDQARQKQIFDAKIHRKRFVFLLYKLKYL